MRPREASRAPWRVREGGLEDIPALVRLDGRCFPPRVAYDAFELACYLLDRGSFCLIAEGRGGRPLGFLVAAGRRGREPARLITLDVHPRCRRRGLGRRLLALAEARIAARRLWSLRLEVAADNPGAQAFYARLGFRPRGRIRGYYPGGIDALLLEKPIGGGVPEPPPAGRPPDGQEGRKR